MERLGCGKKEDCVKKGKRRKEKKKEENEEQVDECPVRDPLVSRELHGAASGGYEELDYVAGLGLLHRSRLSDGGFVVRSERMESKMIQVYNQRRSTIAEGIVSEFQIGTKRTYRNNEQDTDEGAKILKILETAAEPKVLMAEMSSEQLNSFSTYQAKLETDVQKSIEKALEDAGLSGREVTPFMRVIVVGLTNKSYSERCCPREGLITILNPTEKHDLYHQALIQIPFICKQEDLLLNGCLCHRQKAKIFVNCKNISYSPPLLNDFFSEFDIAAFVIYVGEVYTAAHQKKQWVFMTDGSLTELYLEETIPLLAISFCSPCVDCDSVLPINYNLAGSTVSTESVGFCNLIKREKDQMNHLHLKDAASSAQRWAMTSSLTIEKLRGKNPTSYKLRTNRVFAGVDFARATGGAGKRGQAGAEPMGITAAVERSVDF
ncbi:hypothetical protein RJ640_006669 [Escallonia rubra]|uniref:Uncharacterized protein n=1 Tax=Escallonia rubra TaxID=112253 RepID=A0AA88UGS8_9ASTE|nr:hypothetical protein RJ640_006669 [Escallonia rubra]